MSNEEVLDKVQDLILDDKYRKALKLLDKKAEPDNEDASWVRIEILLALEIASLSIGADQSTPDLLSEHAEMYSSWVMVPDEEEDTVVALWP